MHVDAIHVLHPTRFVQRHLQFPFTLAFASKVTVVFVGAIDFFGAFVFLEGQSCGDVVGVTVFLTKFAVFEAIVIFTIAALLVLVLGAGRGPQVGVLFLVVIVFALTAVLGSE